MQLIVFQKDDGTIAVITLAPDILQYVTIEQVAEKDVPYGLPYWILDATAVPAEWDERNTWWLTYDKGTPDGYGGESNEFPAEVLP